MKTDRFHRRDPVFNTGFVKARYPPAWVIHNALAAAGFGAEIKTFALNTSAPFSFSDIKFYTIQPLKNPPFKCNYKREQDSKQLETHHAASDAITCFYMKFTFSNPPHHASDIANNNI